MTSLEFVRWIAILSLTILLNRTSAHAAPDDLVVAPRPNENRAGARFEMNEQQIEANLFQPHGNATQARDHADATLKLRIEEIHRECHLTDPQRDKLLLAAANDTKRFFDQADAVIKKFKTGVAGQMDWNNFWSEAQPLQQKLQRGLFGESSFFEKAIPRVLDEEQRKQYEELSVARRRFWYRSAIESTFVMIEVKVPLKKSQQEELIKLLLEKSRPPKLIGHNARFLVLHRISRLPKDKVQSILNERQWKNLQAETKRFENQVRFLVQQGIIEEEDLEAKPRGTSDTPVSTLVPANAEQAENDK